MSYSVFTRTWWRENRSGNWPNNLEPSMGRKTYLESGLTFTEAQQMAKEYNDTHDPGRYSRKAEIQEN